MTTNHGRELRGSLPIDDSLPDGVSAQTAVKKLSGWSGEIRGEIAVKLVESVSRPGQLLSISLATILEAGPCLRNSCVAKRRKLGRRTRLVALPLRPRLSFELFGVLPKSSK